MPAYPPPAVPVAPAPAAVTTVYTVPTNTDVVDAGGSSVTLASCATPVAVTVTVASGQVVDIVATFDGQNSGDNVTWWGLRRNPSTVLAKGSWYSSSSTKPKSGTVCWTDTAPGTGEVTYELVFQATGGTTTIYGVGDGTGAISASLSPGAGTQITATVRTP